VLEPLRVPRRESEITHHGQQARLVRRPRHEHVAPRLTSPPLRLLVALRPPFPVHRPPARALGVAELAAHHVQQAILRRLRHHPPPASPRPRRRTPASAEATTGPGRPRSRPRPSTAPAGAARRLRCPRAW